MTKESAEKTATWFREEGFAVKAQPSRIARLDWELIGECADGRPVYGFSAQDMALLVSSGQVMRIR